MIICFRFSLVGKLERNNSPRCGASQANAPWWLRMYKICFRLPHSASCGWNENFRNSLDYRRVHSTIHTLIGSLSTQSILPCMSRISLTNYMHKTNRRNWWCLGKHDPLYTLEIYLVCARKIHFGCTIINCVVWAEYRKMSHYLRSAWKGDDHVEAKKWK